MAPATGVNRATTSASIQAPASTRPVFSIGQVLAKLQPEFPDLSPSKLRFLESEELVTPFRTPSSYRKFSGDDIERLRLILTLQRDHFFPLKKIKAHLDAMAAGKASPLPTSVGLTANSVLSTRVRYTAVEMIKAAGASTNLLQDAISANLIAAAENFGDEELTMLTALVQLQRSGIEPRHLSVLRATAEKEFALIERALAPLAKRQGLASRAKSVERANEIAVFMETVRSQILREVISRNAGQA